MPKTVGRALTSTRVQPNMTKAFDLLDRPFQRHKDAHVHGQPFGGVIVPQGLEESDRRHGLLTVREFEKPSGLVGETGDQVLDRVLLGECETRRALGRKPLRNQQRPRSPLHEVRFCVTPKADGLCDPDCCDPLRQGVGGRLEPQGADERRCGHERLEVAILAERQHPVKAVARPELKCSPYRRTPHRLRAARSVARQHRVSEARRA